MPSIVFTLQMPTPTLRERKASLMAAVEEKLGILGQQLYDTVAGKLSGGVLNIGTGALLGSVILSAVAVSGLAMETFVEIPDGSPEHLIGMVHEYGGQRYYPIDPINAQVLRFIVGGSVVFARHVENHPPALERSYLRSSLDEMTEAIYTELQSTIGEVLGSES